jgi:hypothetical protein
MQITRYQQPLTIPQPTSPLARAIRRRSFQNEVQAHSGIRPPEVRAVRGVYPNPIPEKGEAKDQSWKIEEHAACGNHNRRPPAHLVHYCPALGYSFKSWILSLSNTLSTASSPDNRKLTHYQIFGRVGPGRKPNLP